MTGTDKLRKENQSLRNEIADLKEKLQKISENLATMEEQHRRRPEEREMSPEEFIRLNLSHNSKTFQLNSKWKLRGKFESSPILCDRNQLKHQVLTVSNLNLRL